MISIAHFPRAGSVFFLLLGLAAAGCTPPKVLWSQRVWLNGRSFVFARINSLSEGPGGHRVDYRDGGFIVKGAGAITVNGFEISAEDGVVVLANQRVELKPGDEVRFSSNMEWTVQQGPPSAPEPAPAPPAPSPSSPASAPPPPSPGAEKGAAAAPVVHPPGPEKPSP